MASHKMNGVELLLNSSKKVYDPKTQKMIKSAWEAAKLDPHLKLTNNLVPSYESSILEGDCLKVQACVTDFKAFYGTNICNIGHLPQRELADAIAVCGVLVAHDGAILLGKRSKQVAESQEAWHVVGGTLEINRHQYNQHKDDSPQSFEDYFKEKLNPAMHLLKEIKEELGLTLDHISDIISLGLGKNLINNKPEVLMFVQSKLSSQELRDCANHAILQGEHSSLITLPFEELGAFVADNPVSPIGKAALFAAFGWYHYQEKWPKIDLNELVKLIGS